MNEGAYAQVVLYCTSQSWLQEVRWRAT